MLSSVILKGAYGRKYTTPEKASKDWHDGKDFRIEGSMTYCSIRDSQYFLRDMALVGIRLTDGSIFYPKA